MGTISDIVAAVMADLNTGRAPPLKTLIGERHLAGADTYPRLVWVPTTDSFGPPENGGYNPRPLATNLAGFAVHCWDADHDAARALMHAVMAALHRKASAYSYKPVAAMWLTAGELQQAGDTVVLDITLKLPVVDRTTATTMLNTITGTAAESDVGAVEEPVTLSVHA